MKISKLQREKLSKDRQRVSRELSEWVLRRDCAVLGVSRRTHTQENVEFVDREIIKARRKLRDLDRPRAKQLSWARLGFKK